MIQYDLYGAILVDFRFSNTCFLYDATGFLNLSLTWFEHDFDIFWHASSIFFSCTFSQLYREAPRPAQCMSTTSLALHRYGRDKCRNSEVWTVETSSNACCSCLVQAHAGLSFPVSQRQGSDEFNSSFFFVTFRNATICGGVVSQSHEDPKGVSHKLCCVMAMALQNSITFTSCPWKQHQCLELSTHAWVISWFFAFKLHRRSCIFRANK